MTEETTNVPVNGAENEQKPKTLNDVLPGEGTNLVYV